MDGQRSGERSQKEEKQARRKRARELNPRVQEKKAKFLENLGLEGGTGGGAASGPAGGYTQ